MRALRRAYRVVRRADRRTGLRCLRRGRHEVKRTRLGILCITCRRHSDDYEDFSLTGGYVNRRDI